MINKTSAYSILERFSKEAIDPLRAMCEKEQNESRKLALEDKINFYTEMYSVFFRLIYAHTVFIKMSRRFHENMVRLGVYNSSLDDDGKLTEDYNLDILDSEFGEAYKDVMSMINYYSSTNNEYKPDDCVDSAMRNLQEKLGVLYAE